MAIVGISGKIGSGKDLTGKIIQALTDKPISFDGLENLTEEDIDYKVWDVPKFNIKRFADKLKDIVCLLTNCTREQLEDREFKEKELGPEWWYYKYYLHRSKSKFRGDTILDEQGRPERFPIISEKSHEQEWKFLSKEFVENLSEEEREYHNVELVKLSRRMLLQLIGTECGRNIIHPNIWVNALMSEYRHPVYYLCDNCGADEIFELKEEDTCPICDYNSETNLVKVFTDEFSNWIITDMRFPNELKAIKDRGGITIRVEREQCCGDVAYCEHGDGFNCKKLMSTHESEIALDDVEFDYVIDNNGTMLELAQKVKEILTKEGLI